MVKFSYKNRSQMIQQLQEDYFDLVIIGGGITGAGLALQAAASGLKTALVEMQDFAEGTSSRSTKLVHGGIRYLKNFDVEVVGDTVSERAVVQQIAPHIPKPDPMLLPVYDEPDPTFTLFELKVAMGMYDTLADIDQGPYKNRLLSKEEVLVEEPSLNEEGLLGGGIYLDFNNNDSRLVIENLKQAQADGAVVVSRLQAVGFIYDDEDQIRALEVKDTLTGEGLSVQGHVFINTTGPWSDTIRSLDFMDEAPAQMRPTKGVHLVVDRERLDVHRPIYFDTGESDGRMVFVIPREDKTYFGTTDTDYEGDLTQPQVTVEDVDYLLGVINRRFPQAQIELADIESSWAGLRPLIAGNQASDYNGGDNGSLPDDVFDHLLDLFISYQKGKVDRHQVEMGLLQAESNLSESHLSPSGISRGSQLTQSASGLFTLAGGKITDYRKMAQGAMKEIIASLFEQTGQDFHLINSKTYPVSGGRFNANDLKTAMSRFTQLATSKGLPFADARQVAQTYGSNTAQVLTYLEEAKDYAQTYDYPLVVALGLVYALNHEMVYSLDDFFTRRTNYSLFKSNQVQDLIKPVAATLGQILGLSEEEQEDQIQAYRQAESERQLLDLKE